MVLQPYTKNDAIYLPSIMAQYNLQLSDEEEFLPKQKKAAELEQGKYYHLFYHSENNEIIFNEELNYLYFIKRYEVFVGESVATLAYCLTPSQFHFIVKILASDTAALKRHFISFLEGYSKAINFGNPKNTNQIHLTLEAIEIDDESYLPSLIAFLHQSPIRENLIEHLEDWPHSSYPDLAGLRFEKFIDAAFVGQWFSSAHSFRKYSEALLDLQQIKFWDDDEN